MKKIVLVTGVCGHIGSAFVRSLSWQKNFRTNNEYEVIGVDNMLTQRYSSLFDMEFAIKFYEKNFLDVDIPEGAVVVHLGAITDAASSINNQQQIDEINIDQTKRFIDKCIAAKVSRFIFPSSTSVYGVAASVVHEDDPSYENPQSPYAVSKLKIEQYLESKQSELEYVILRFGTIFGPSPGMRFHTAINKFCWQSAIGLPITVWKENYQQVRPYLGLADAISALVHAIHLESHHCLTKYNVLTGNYKLSTIVELIKECIPQLTVQMVDTPLLNQHTYKVDDSKIRHTGFQPTADLKTEIVKTISLLRNLK